MPPEPARPTRVWDLPTRVFHWTLALSLVGSVVSAKIGGNAMTWHFRFGYLVFGLLVFRLVWGLVGGRWSRFASFAYGPRTLLRYLRGEAPAAAHLDVGHSPLGALSVFALLLALTVQVATGLVADDEIAHLGPLNRFVSSDDGLLATGWHKAFGQWIVLSLAALHVAAIAWYFFARRRDLVTPMLSGDKALPPGVPASRDSAATRLLALGLAAAAGAGVAWVVSLGG